MTINSLAGPGPISRGSRTVPPQPGSRPSLTSGAARLVVGLLVATRKSQARASSSPPPTQSPSITATLGQAAADSWASNCRPRSQRPLMAVPEQSQSRSSRPISAPARNEPGRPDATSRPLGGCRPSFSSNCPSSSRNASVMTFWRWPGTSIVTATMPSASRSTVRLAGSADEFVMANPFSQAISAVARSAGSTLFACPSAKNR